MTSATTAYSEFQDEINELERSVMRVSEGDKGIDQIAFLETLCKRHFDLIRFADHKAQFMLRIALAMFGAAFIGVPPAVMALNRFLNEGGWKFALFIAVIVLYTVCAALLFVAIMKLVTVVRPRIVDSHPFTSGMHFEAIAMTEPDAFRHRIMTLSQKEMIDELLGHAYHSAGIARKKYARLSDAISWMLGGGISGVLFALILLVSSGLLG